MSLSGHLRRIRERVGHELLLLPAVSALIRDEDGRLLLHQRPDATWSLPAGAIEPGETPAQAVAREVREETGLVVRPVRLAGVFGGTAGRTRYPNGDEVEYTVLVFDCAVVGGAPSLDGEETTDLGWFAPAEARDLLEFPCPPELLGGASAAAWFQATGEPSTTE